MKLSLAVTVHLALLAAAAPISLKLRRDNGDEVSPDADVTSKIAYGSLKSAAQMMNAYNNDNDDSSKNKQDYGNNMPVSMTPNSEMTFPTSKGHGSLSPKPASKEEDIPTPVTEDEEEDEVTAPTPSSSSTVITSPTASPSASAVASTTDAEEEEEDDRELKKKPEAEATPSASPSAAPKKPESPLAGLPLLGGLLGGL
ncbi:hypothetical protein BDV12DRAFT_195167 [Aspergillus spectabilis]